jgi:molybdopterin-guanine dinucleotide biosynthesis protein A
MGRPKALLPFAGESLLERVLRRTRALAKESIVVSAADLVLPPLPAGVRVVTDAVPLQGPLAGILQGLRAATTEICFVCACDLPFVSLRLARALLELSPGFDAVIPRWQGHLQPLLATYHRTLIPVLEELLAAGLGPMSIVKRARCLEVAQEEIERIEPGAASFFDIDTPEAYAEALRKAATAPETEP